MKPLSRVDDNGRECLVCGEYKPWSDYGKGSGSRGYTTRCKQCYNLELAERRRNNPKLIREYCNRYEKTRKGFIMRIYRNMVSRISGVQKMKYHLYANKELLDKQTFYNWALSSDEFHKMFTQYEESGYDRKLAPSVDRINSDVGYILENMEWVTQSENSRRSSISKQRKIKENK